ncbi:hypothetical protein PASE110613_11485 [Paenibacillus sediminis]|uniref:Uncharacterized protein YaaR (DUF327 family) n=1 Tax=Paenibacillus sediminis TaxID=664909 RepID=A0ABS4H346_9BACL|nr:hypothetical protein [Paenibacillus sediminis]MBP1936962.1 uncharacterized protein YaaR (DUF327 family) [Paenibacillus sediminis]
MRTTKIVVSVIVMTGLLLQSGLALATPADASGHIAKPQIKLLHHDGKEHRDDDRNDDRNDDRKGHNRNGNKPSVQTIDQQFKSLLNNADKLSEAVSYLKNNMKYISKDKASQYVTMLEDAQQKYLTTFQAKINANGYQGKLMNLFSGHAIDMNNIDKIRDSAIRTLLQKTRDSGYRVESSEGFYYPIIDYSVYSSFKPYVTSDIEAYITIMTVEASKIAVKDAAIIITWDELLDRAHQQSKFIEKFPNSVRVRSVTQLYQQYQSFALYGTDNTPLFRNDNNEMDSNAKNAYWNFINNGDSSYFKRLITEFMSEIWKNNYKLNDTINRYRSSHNTPHPIVINPVPLPQPNRYAAAGIDNADAFEKAFKDLQYRVLYQDINEVAKYIAYPIQVKINGKATLINSRNDFISYYGAIFNASVTNALLNQKVEDTFVNTGGVSVGNGVLWIKQTKDANYPYQIFAIDN